MSSTGSACESNKSAVQIIYEHEVHDSSEEPPMDEWSSLNLELPNENIKRLQYDEGIYDPGSGIICSKYIPLSASSVLRHPYYNYPGIVDPGIEEALLKPEPIIIYPDDGQDLFIALCKISDLCPIQSFHRQLLEKEINLSYYGIHPKAFRPIALSLKTNKFVTVLNLTDNWISLDGCFHLGEMLVENITLTELNLYGCRIGPEGARRLFVNLHLNRSLKKLNLSNNQLKDQGMEYLANAIFFGADVAELNLTRNELTANAVLALCRALETKNKLTHLNLSWNNILSPNAIYILCQRLSESDCIQELNLSWNSLAGGRVGNGLNILLTNGKIKRIDLSNNKLSTPFVTPVLKSSPKALDTLNLSYNPLTPTDALNLLNKLKERRVKLKKLLLDDVTVTDEFIEQRDVILSLSFRKNTIITHGYVQQRYVPKFVDMRELIFNRIEALCKMPKKKMKLVDFAIIVQEIYKENKGPMDAKQFSRAVKSQVPQLDDDLLGQLFKLFPGPKSKAVLLDMDAVVDYVKRKWPDRELPPTPPPEAATLPASSEERK